MLRDLDEAYQSFFRRVKNGEKPGFPRSKSRKGGMGGLRLTGAIRVEEDSIRRDALHKATATLMARGKLDDASPSVIVIEDLNVSGMVSHHNLAQAIRDVGCGEFGKQLEYRCEWYGVKLIRADGFFLSSRLCHHCGCINSDITWSDRA